MQDWTFFLLINDLDGLGGSSQLFCTIAVELKRAGHEVLVYTDHPAAAGNRYVHRLEEAGITVNAGVQMTNKRPALVPLLFPVRFGLAAALALLNRRSLRHNWQRVGVRLERFLVHQRYSASAKRAFLRAVASARRAGRTVLVHVHRGPNGVRWARAAGLPVVYVENSTPTAHVAIDWWFAADPTPASNAARGWRRLRRVSRWIDLIIAGSQRAAHGVREQMGYGGEIAILPWMVEAAAPCDGAADGSLVVGTAGRLESEKGHLFLIEALADVLKSTPVHLVVAGDGSLRREIESLATTLGVWQQVELCGAQDDEGMERFWRRIHLLVLPSLREGTPLVALEAMARRVAVVATDVGGVRELLADGRCGCVVDPASPNALAAAMIEMANDPVRRRTLAQAGYDRFMSVYAPQAAMPLWLQTYQAVLDRWSREHGPTQGSS